MADIEESAEDVDDSPFNSQDFLDSDPPPEFLLAMMKKLTGLTDVDRKELMQKLLKQEFLKLQEPVGLVQHLLSNQLFVLLTFLSISTTVFVFFGYKLYKSLKEKERKRDEKKKLRQQKKKK